MSEFMIRALCPSCDVVELLGRKCRLNIYTDGTSRLTFACPNCELRVIIPLEPDQHIRLFRRIPRIYVDPPAEVFEPVRIDRARFDESDIRQFVEDLTIYSVEQIIREARHAGA